MKKEDLDFLNSHKDCNFVEKKIKVSSKFIKNKDDVLKEIKNFSPIDGWISTQSTSARRIQSSLFEVKDEYIISGEFCNSNGVSLSVRFNGEKWILISYIEAEEAELLIKRKVKQLSKISDNTYINYDVFYKFDSDFGYRPYCSAFIGFTEGKND